MGHLHHLSVRVPWRDRPWDDAVCDHPLDNSSCLLLKVVGERRDDAYEVAHRGESITGIETDKIPCLSERATFMSPRGYAVTKTHPYSYSKILQGHLLPTTLAMPGHSVEAVPFGWMNRGMFEEEVWDGSSDYQVQREERIEQLLGFTPAWIMDSKNQQAVIRQFFDSVVEQESLVFFYLKHSPFQEADARRLLVGAARVTTMKLPGLWEHAGTPPFYSSMWETTVSHSLRTEMKDGILLPYQQLVALMDEGHDVSPALAWAPEGHAVDFSYVTEHVTDDVAISALQSIQSAVDGARQLGLTVPPTGVDWTESQIKRLWQLRGPAPGLGPVLSLMGVIRGHFVARRIVGDLAPGADPWPTVERALADPSTLPDELVPSWPKTVGKVWAARGGDERQALRLLSGFDLSDEQAAALFKGDSQIPLSHGELVDNPYYAAICTYGQPEHVGFSVIDRGCFPPANVSWKSILPDRSLPDGPQDRRRVEALLVEALEQRAAEGDTLAPVTDLVAAVGEMQLSQACPLDAGVLAAHGLDPSSLEKGEEWSPLAAAETADSQGALKLLWLAEAADTVRQHIDARIKGTRVSAAFNARALIDQAIDDDHVDATEELARTEKAAGLAELYSSRLSVLVGPAGTGKTTLLNALANKPDVKSKGVLLLAPTGKARVQLLQKVGGDAQTIAQFLVRRGRYEPSTGRYVVTGEATSRANTGTVIVDEASMLTEEMLAAVLDALGTVGRLILVGDPRQLPPIGAGRPFVDLVQRLRPDDLSGQVRVGDGYVELRILRRQGGENRDDLALAQWFGGESLPAAADEIWSRLRTGEPMRTLRYASWRGRPVLDALREVLMEELELDPANPEDSFALSYGGIQNGSYINWRTGPDGSGRRSEAWQILSPTRSRQFGTVEVNRALKRSYRQPELVKAMRKPWEHATPAPLGPEQIVLGDKVINIRNAKLKGYPPGGLDYVANGEIGVVVGRIAKQGKRPIHVEFSSQVGHTYTWWHKETDDPGLELAWAVTVHKSQGSEFRTTFVVIPAKVRLSRELLYTALTRQTHRVVILHEGTVDELLELARPSESETASRLTDLFSPPLPYTLQRADGGMNRLDKRLMHVTGTGVPVRSKNEVILADILEKVAPGRWQYERPFLGLDGTHRLPDFTVDTLAGTTVLWEHLGMLDDPEYEKKWQLKLKWYADQGVLPAAEGGGPNGLLVTTDDRDGVDVPSWNALAVRHLGGSGATRRPAKKTAKKK